MMEDAVRRCRQGVGKVYIHVPKPRLEVVQELLHAEASQLTFRPHIDNTSSSLAKRKGRTGEKSIEDILSQEADAARQRAEQIKKKVEEEKYKGCSFQPHLYSPPKGVVPAYRGQTRNSSPPLTQQESRRDN